MPGHLFVAEMSRAMRGGRIHAIPKIRKRCR